jgi:RNA polymerase sigma factor (sigma-70 family)
MTTQDQLAEQFEEARTHLRAVAYRMLGSVAEADDAVQEAWLRLSRSDTSEVASLRAWLTTVVSRICLDFLRARRSRREESLDAHVPDPVVSGLDADPKQPLSRPTRSASPCSSYSRRCLRVSGWRSCSMTCSACRSKRSAG